MNPNTGLAEIAPRGVCNLHPGLFMSGEPNNKMHFAWLGSKRFMRITLL